MELLGVADTFNAFVSEELPSHCKKPVFMTNLNTPTGEMSLEEKEQLFEKELLPFVDAVYNFALAQSKDAARAEDLVQETYLRAWKSFNSYTPETNARAWLFTICKNLWINQYRIQQRHQKSNVDFDLVVKTYVDDDEAETSFQGLSEELRDLHFGDEVTKALNQLSPEYREVLLLDLEDLKYEEISALLEIPVGTVRSRLHRARGMMANQLRQYARGQGLGKADRSFSKQKETATIPGGTQETVAVPVSIPN